MLAQLDDLINQVAAQKRAARVALQQELDKNNHEREGRAWADLRALFGQLQGILEPMLSEPAGETNSDGVLVAVEWLLHNDAQEIAPITLRWSHGATWGNQEPTIGATVNDGGRGKVWHKNVTTDLFPEVLYYARLSYAGYKTRVETERQEREEEERREISQEIHELTYFTWSARMNEADVLGRVERLKLLEANDLAEKKLAEWRANVAIEQIKNKRREEQRAKDAAARAEYDRQMAEWQAACEVWAEQEEARLWQPWTLWKVRYVPFDVSLIHADFDDDNYQELIQEIYTLDDPKYIAQQRAVVSLRRVKDDGTVTNGYAIACFLDAEPIHYNSPETNHHRCYWAGGYVVCVPPFVTEELVAAPVRPAFLPIREVQADDLPF